MDTVTQRAVSPCPEITTQQEQETRINMDDESKEKLSKEPQVDVINEHPTQEEQPPAQDQPRMASRQARAQNNFILSTLELGRLVQSIQQTADKSKLLSELKQQLEQILPQRRQRPRRTSAPYTTPVRRD